MQDNNSIQDSLVWEKVEAKTSNQSPTPREGLALIFLNDKNKYLIFGGETNLSLYSDIFTFCPCKIKYS